jgi:hypothetical protein
MAPESCLARPSCRSTWARSTSWGSAASACRGIAEVLLTLGYAVQGSDARESDLTRRSGPRGPRSTSGRRPRTSRARRGGESPRPSSRQPRARRARARGLPVVRRARCWPSSCGSRQRRHRGHHGKTTTTTMVATLLEQGGSTPRWSTGRDPLLRLQRPDRGRRVDGGGGRRVGSAPSTACPPPSRSSPTSTPSTWSTGAPSRPSGAASSTSCRASPSTGWRCAAPTTRRCRRWWGASPTGGCGPSGSTPRPTCGR